MSADEQVDVALAPTLAGFFPDSPVSRRKIPPSLAERYEEIRYLGEGGMGTVYRALDPRLGRTVAVKLLKGDDPELWRRFIAEARAQARIVHEHVVRVYEAGQVDGEPYIAMQYIDGEPLSKMKEKLALEQRIKVMQEISAAVHEAHRLGIIHRDIKPSNILCERREDGTIKPYIMDFGLAREVSDQGQTQTGAVLGTPSYMSPEQAKGDIRSLDRRSDVYSLGATLFDLIAGRPPFVSEHAWNLLMAVAYEDAPLLSKVVKGAPADLETIVMKCLEREPSQRYESARALSEDLQRYLDGEPIFAKRAFIGYVVWKKAKKHKLLSTLFLALLVGALVSAGVWVRARRQAAEQARLAQELGEGMKEMELFLRAAYELPTHDVERERDIVRERLREIEQRMRLAGKAGEGPGHYALGRGYLALGDPSQAKEHLETAYKAGYVSPDMQYAFGRALGELFRRAVEETKRITNEEERKKKVEQLEKELRDPALSHLRAAISAKIEVPAYAEGLIALYEGKNDEALAKAKESFEKAPWMYEAKKLEGDALFAEGSKYRHDAAFDYEKMKGYFEPAARAYESAADMGRSDPDVHRAACELWEKMGQAAWMKGVAFQPSFDAAIAACSRATEASSRDGHAEVQKALVLSTSVYVQADAPTEATAELAEQAMKAAERGLKASPTDVMAHYAMADALYQQAYTLQLLGRKSSMDRAIEAYKRTIALDGRFTWALNSLGNAYLEQASNAALEGKDCTELLSLALRHFDAAIEVDPKFALAVGKKLHAYRVLIETQIERGRDAREQLQALEKTITQNEAMGSGAWLVAFWRTRAHRLAAENEFALGRDPSEHVELAIRTIRDFAGEDTQDFRLLKERAQCHSLMARYASRTRRDAAPELDQALEHARRAAIGREPLPNDLRIILAEVHLQRIRSGSKSLRNSLEILEEAFTLVRPILSSAGSDPSAFVLAAEILALRAELREKSAQDSDADVEQGLSMVRKALETNPHLGKAFVQRAKLLLVRAQSMQGATQTTDKERRLEALREASAALRNAFRESPSLEKDYAGLLKEAESLLD